MKNLVGLSMFEVQIVEYFFLLHSRNSILVYFLILWVFIELTFRARWVGLHIDPIVPDMLKQTQLSYY